MPLSQAPEPQLQGVPTGGELPAGALFSGPARYRAITPWGPVEASAMTLVAAGGPAIVAAPIVYALAWGGFEVGEMSLASPTVLGLMAGTQLLSIFLIWLLAGRANMRPDVLQYRQAPLSLAGCVLAGLLIVVLTGLLEFGLHKVVGFDPFSETKVLIEGLRSPYWLGTVVVAVVLAPLWEELAFRGFLLTALAKTRLGIVGAGLICNSVWTAMHLQYSPSGLASVFLAGALLTWIVWRTASMRAAIVAHAIVNATSLAFLAVMSPA
jgi:membrane protease YdiL (CAAX protease family)